ncbi:hypothetical protein Haur_5003 (plasmid) [Herpetosiphon aurantiacus DSM 785]|uniref:Uncharacterized protein n=1 Tax=Herpetosiphon aurantiacus (strain ATCC 23779 / DSM 785 / 114-95) TaxID=316274 RepID=A9B8G9_HERA2|nr:hypothetical protein Haur_5003 [Herpetosiphon aurantiacus DSM 785]
MTLDTLQQHLLSAYDSTARSLRLVSATLGSAPIAELLGQPYLQIQTLEITDTDGPLTDGSAVVVSGLSTLFGFTLVQVAASFTLDDQAIPQLALKLLLPDGTSATAWRFADSFPQLAGTIFDDVTLSPGTMPFLLFASAPCDDSGTSFAAGLSFYGALTPGGPSFGYVTAVLGTLASEIATGPIIPLPNGPTINLALDLASSFNKYFPSLSQELPVELRLLSAFDQSMPPTAPRSMVGLELSTTFDLGTGSIRLATMLTGTRIGVLKLRASIDNLPLPAPGQLVALLGGDELVGSLPERYQNPDTVRLSGFGFGISLATLQPVNLWLQLAALEGEGWEIIPGDLTLKRVRAWFTVNNPLESTRSAQTAIFAELDVPSANPLFSMEVHAYAPNYRIQAALVEGTTVKLTDLLAVYLPQVTDAPEFLLEELGLAVEFASPKNRLTFETTIEQDTPWMLPLGGLEPLQVQFITIALDNFSNGDSMGGLIDGQLTILGAQTSCFYQLPGSFRISAHIPAFDVNLKRIASELAGSDWVPPSWLPDFTLPQTYLAVERDRDGEQSIFTLLLQAEPAGLGTLGLQVLRERGSWGFAAGVDLIADRVSDVPGLAAFKPFDDLFQFSNLLLVISSIASPAFTFPDMSHLGSSGSGGRQIVLPSQAGGLRSGLTLYADITLSNSPTLTMLQTFLKISGDIGITMLLGENPMQNARLFASVDVRVLTTLRIVAEFGATLQGSETGLFLQGQALVVLADQPLEFDMAMLLVDDGALIAGNLKGGPVNYHSLQISNLALELGVDFEGVPSVGFAATIDTPTFESSLAIFFDSTDPANSMLAGAVSDLTLRDAVEVLVGGVLPVSLGEALAQVGLTGTGQFLLSGDLSTALDSYDMTAVAAALQAVGVTFPQQGQSALLVVNTPGHVWHLTDLTTMRHFEFERQGNQIVGALEAQLYWVPGSRGAYIGQTYFPSGFLLSGTIVFFGLEVSLSFTISRGQGISAEAQLSPIAIGGSLLTITSLGGKAGPHLSLSTAAPEHFFLSGDIQLLGIIGVGVQISIAQAGLLFDLRGELLPGMTFDLHASFTSLHSFSASGSVVLGVSRMLDFGPLGSLSLNVGINGQLTIAHQDGVSSATFQGGFQFGTNAYRVGPITLDISRAALAELGETVAHHLEAVFHHVMHDLRGWFELVKQNLIQGISGMGQIIHVLRQHFGQDKHAVATLLKELLVQGVEPIADALRSTFELDSRGLARLLHDTGYAVEDVTRALRTEFDKSHREAAAILKEVGYSADAVARALLQKFENDRTRAIQVLREVGYDAREVTGVTVGVFQQSAADTVALLKAAGYEVEEAARGLHQALALDSRAVVTLLGQSGYDVKAVGRALQHTFDKNANEASRILKELNYPIHDLAKVLRHVYDKVAKEAGNVLKELGYASKDVSDSLQKVFDLGEKEVEKLIKDIF